LVFLGLLFTLQIGSMNVGTSLTSAAHSAILLNLYAVHTVVLAHFLIPGDRLTLRKLTGVLVAYAGIVLLFVHQIGGGAPTLLGRVLPPPTDLRRARGRSRHRRSADARPLAGERRGGRRHRAHEPLSPRCYNPGMRSAPSKTLEVVPNPHPDRDYEVSMTVPEFTCLCPRTGQPDFATIRIR